MEQFSELKAGTTSFARTQKSVQDAPIVIVGDGGETRTKPSARWNNKGIPWFWAVHSSVFSSKD